jgi:hypothetical protein
MDRLTFFVASAHLKLRLEYLKRHPELLKERKMTPKLQGALQALEMLKHDVESDAEEIVKKVSDLQSRRKVVRDKTHGKLDAAGNSIGDIEDFVSALEGSNGAPLDNSSGSSAASGTAAEPEHLTVNGVSQG